jgi:hypothetical protein
MPALQVEQVKKGCFEAIYEDNVWKVKPNSNDQNWKSVLEFLFLSQSQNAFCKRKGVTGLFSTAGCKAIQPIQVQFLREFIERFSCNLIIRRSQFLAVFMF